MSDSRTPPAKRPLAALAMGLLLITLPLAGMAWWLAPPTTVLRTALPAAANTPNAAQVFDLEEGAEFPGSGMLWIGDELVSIYRADAEGKPLNQGRLVKDHPDSFVVRARGVRGTPVQAHPSGTEVRVPGGYFFPEGVSGFAEETDKLFLQILYITGLAYLITQTWLVGVTIHLARTRPTGPAASNHGKTVVELFWLFLVGGTLLWLSHTQEDVWERMKGEGTLPALGPIASFEDSEAWVGPAGPDGKPTKRPIEWQILAVRYKWFFRHAGKDGRFGTGDDVVSPVLRVPVDRDVRFVLRSPDVIHSFSMPHLRVKQDVVPGLAIPGHFRATALGRYPILCAELCGANHSSMAGELQVMEDDDFYAWIMQESERSALDNLGADPSAPEFEEDDLDPLPRAEWFGAGTGKFWWWWDQNPLPTGYDQPLGSAR